MITNTSFTSIKDFQSPNGSRYAPHAFCGVLAAGRARTILGNRENSKPDNCSKMPQNPRRPVHALLGGETGMPSTF